jgi:hypothetical protein
LGDRRGIDARGLDAVLDSRDTIARFMTRRGVPNFRELVTPELVAAHLAAHPETRGFWLAVD